MKSKALKPEVAQKYKLEGVEAGKHCFAGLGEIDLCEMDLATADHLAANGFKYLVPKKHAATAKIAPSV